MFAKSTAHALLFGAAVIGVNGRLGDRRLVASSSNDRILIIGAGIAGLSAALDLLEQGHENVTLIEPKANLGGRLATISPTHNGTTFEGITLGAHWIMGTEDREDLAEKSVLHALAKNVGIPDSDYMQSHIYTDVAFSPPELAVTKKNYKKYANCLDSEAESAWFRNNTADKMESTWQSVFGKCKVPPYLHNYLKTGLQEIEFGASADINDMWVGAIWEGIDYTSEHNWKRGWTPIIDYLEQQIVSKGGEIFKERRVAKVLHRTKEDDVRVFTVGVDSGVEKRFDVDRVICTVSLGVLKQTTGVRVVFEPPLPSSHQDAIDNIGFGLSEKTILYFPNRFWEQSSLYNKYTIDYVGNQEGNTTNLTYTEIYFDQEKASVQFFMGGRAVEEKVKSNPTNNYDHLRDEAMDVLRDIFDREGKVAVPNPVGYYQTRWCKDVYFRGGYSYLTNANIENGVVGLPDSHAAFDGKREGVFEGYSRDRLALAKPIESGAWAGRLFFAGEATSLGLPSLATGAMESGKRVAIEVDNAITSRC